MEEQEDIELNSAHKNIKNTSTYGTILTEHQLKTSRKILYTTKATRKVPCNQVGQIRASGQDWHLWEGAVEEERSGWVAPCPRKSLCLLGGLLGQTEEIEDSGLCSWGMGTCWLARNHGKKRPAPTAATLTHSPAQNMPWAGLPVCEA